MRIGKRRTETCKNEQTTKEQQSRNTYHKLLAENDSLALIYVHDKATEWVAYLLLWSIIPLKRETSRANNNLYTNALLLRLLLWRFCPERKKKLPESFFRLKLVGLFWMYKKEIFSREIFEMFKGSDGGHQGHSVNLGTNNNSVDADR